MQTIQILFVTLFISCVYNSEDFKRVCYFTTWSNHLQVISARFHISDIDPSLCTHAIFAFAKVNTVKLRLERLEVDDDNGLGPGSAAGKFYDFTNLKVKNPKLKTLLSIGGASMSESLHNIVETRERRIIFAQNCRIFLRDRNFDGLDVDWEFPGVYKDLFTELLKTLLNEFERDAKESNRPRLLLTIAGAAPKKEIDGSYNVTEIVKYVDFINVMAYDYFGPWSLVTGFTGALYSRHSNPAFNPEYSQEWSMRYWMKKGAPPDMLVMGTTATATSFTLKNPSGNHTVGAPVKSNRNGTIPGLPGPFRKMAGHLAYYEACNSISANRAVTKWDDEQKQNFAYYGNQWIGYNSPQSMREKVKFAKSVGLGGIMFWTFDLDDYSGKFCGQGKFPLLNAIASADMTGNYTRAPTTVTTKSITTINTETEVRHTVSGNTDMRITDNNTEMSTELTENTEKETHISRTDTARLQTTTIPTTIKPKEPVFRLYVVGNGAISLNVGHMIMIVLSLTVFCIFL